MFQDEYLIQLWLEHDSHEIYPMNFIPCNNLFAIDAFGCQNTIDTNVLLNYYLTKFCEDNHRCSQFPCADWWRGQPPGFTLFWVNDKSTQSNHSLPRTPRLKTLSARNSSWCYSWSGRAGEGWLWWWWCRWCNPQDILRLTSFKAACGEVGYSSFDWWNLNFQLFDW